MDYQKEIEKIDIKIKDRERQINEILLRFAEAYWQVWKFNKSGREKKPLVFEVVESSADMARKENELKALEVEIEKFKRDREVFMNFLSTTSNKGMN
jgi:hypothetical protein